ncbi:MAG: GAF domain-containing protein [Nitriliruptoraceae bacterium]
MEQRRVVRVLAAIAAQPSNRSLTDRMCAAAQQQLATSGVGVSLTVDDDLLEPVAGTEGARGGETLQAELGEGPSYTSSRSGWPVLVPDLQQDGSWPAFSAAATALGLSSVYAFPLRRGAVRIGAFTLYRDVQAYLTDEQHANALVYARLTHDLMMSLQSGRPVGQLDQLILDGTADGIEVHQAAGVVSVQLSVDVGAALAVLRARAFSTGQSLRDLAGDVVARRVRLDD